MKIRVQNILSMIVFICFISINESATAQTLNDKDLKKNTTPISNSLSVIKQLQPITFEYDLYKFKQLSLPAGTQFGFITDDVKQLLPSVISSQSNWYTAGKNNQRAITTTETDLQKLVPLLVGAVKEQQAEIEKLKAEVQQLKQAR